MKSIEEAAKERAGLKKNQRIDDEEKYYNGHLCEKYFCFKSGVEFAQRWIPAEEELPEKSMEIMKDGNYTMTVEPVLIKTSNGRHAIAKRKMFLDHGWNWSGSVTFNDSVTHWRPIELK